ncbi:MAG: response regulator [Fimbriimonas sp.]
MGRDGWVLVIEDDNDDLLMIERAKRQVTPNVPLRAARTAREALGLLHQARPALILLDARLSGIHCLDLLNMLRSHPTAGRSPIVLLSNHDEEATVAAAYAAGANGFVVKLGDYDACMDAIRSTLRYWLSANRVPGDCAQNRVYA